MKWWEPGRGGHFFATRRAGRPCACMQKKSHLEDGSFLCLVVVVDAGLEHVLGHAADRAAPVSGKILKSSAGLDAVLGIAFRGIISISAGITKILLHMNQPPLLDLK